MCKITQRDYSPILCWKLDSKPSTRDVRSQADISLRLKESTALMEAVLSLQPRDANAPAGQRPDDVVMAVAQDLVAQLPGGLEHRKV